MRKPMVVVLAGLALLAVAAGKSSAQATPGGDYQETSWLNPRAPRVGDVYSLYVEARNLSRWPIVFRASLVRLPDGDRALGNSMQTRLVQAGQSVTFRFDIDCGVEGGTVVHNLSAVWAEQPTNGGDYQTSHWLNPADPMVGENYALYRRVTNHSNWPVLFRASLTGLPAGDYALGKTSQSLWVGPGQSRIFRFDIHCGVEGGRVFHNLSTVWARQPMRGNGNQ